MRMTVIGTGYLGAVHAACMAEHRPRGPRRGQRRPRRSPRCRRAARPSSSPGSRRSWSGRCGSGKLRFSTSLQEAAEFGDVHFICVGTPQLPGGDRRRPEPHRGGRGRAGPAPDPGLPGDRQVHGAGRHRGPAGGPDRRAGPGGRRRGAGLEPGVPPRGLRGPGHAAAGPDRGRRRRRTPPTSRCARSTPACWTRARPTSRPTWPPRNWSRWRRTPSWPPRSPSSTRWPTCATRPGADVMTLADALGHDTRIGRRFLSAGLGFGGGCLSKDIRAFMARADELGVGDSLQFLREVDQINTGRRALAVEVARELAGGSFAGRNVAVLGAAFKPDTDDVRDSPALERGPGDPGRGRGGAGARPPGHLQRAPGLARRWTTSRRRSRPARRPTWCCTSPSGASTATIDPVRAASRWSGRRGCSTGATCCRSASGGRPGGPCGRWARPGAPDRLLAQRQVRRPRPSGLRRAGSGTTRPCGGSPSSTRTSRLPAQQPGWPG